MDKERQLYMHKYIHNSIAYGGRNLEAIFVFNSGRCLSLMWNIMQHLDSTGRYIQSHIERLKSAEHKNKKNEIYNNIIHINEKQEQ